MLTDLLTSVITIAILYNALAEFPLVFYVEPTYLHTFDDYLAMWVSNRIYYLVPVDL